MVSALWIAGTCAILAVALLVAGYVTVEAQEDTRHSTFPPNADRILMWHSGDFELTCTDAPRNAKRTASFHHDNYADYFVFDPREAEISQSGIISKGSSNPHFQIFKTEINNTAWKSYGVAYGYTMCLGGDEIFDFTLTGKCDGSNISVKTSDPLISLIQKNGTDPSNNYHAWCGYIPDDLDRLNNKIF